VIGTSESSRCLVIMLAVCCLIPSSSCSVMRYATASMGFAGCVANLCSTTVENRILARVSREVFSPGSSQPLPIRKALASSAFFMEGEITFMVVWICSSGWSRLEFPVTVRLVRAGIMPG